MSKASCLVYVSKSITLCTSHICPWSVHTHMAAAVSYRGTAAALTIGARQTAVQRLIFMACLLVSIFELDAGSRQLQTSLTSTK